MMGLKSSGSLSMKIAPCSSLRVWILPLSSPVKKVSCTWVRVCLLVLNLLPPTFKWIILVLDLVTPGPGGELLAHAGEVCISVCSLKHESIHKL